MNARLGSMRPLLALLVLLPSAALAGEEGGPRIGGHVKGYVFQQLADPFHLARVGSRLQLSVAGGAGEPASYFAAVDFDLRSSVSAAEQGRGGGLAVYPVELYLNLSQGPLELRLGQQFVFWGRTTWVNPTDVVTPWDYENMASEIEDYRVAPPAARLGWWISGELLLDLVWVPIFVPSRLALVAPAELGGLPVFPSPVETPAPTPANGELGARLSQSISGLALDWSLAAYRGWDKMPAVTVQPLLSTEPPPVPSGFSWQQRYERMTMVGGDLAKALGAFVFKAEGALKLGEDPQGRDPQRRNDRLEYVAGLDWALGEDLDLGAQYVGRHLLDYDRDAERAALTQPGGAAPPFVAQATSHQASLRLTAKLGSELGVQALGLYDLTYRDFFVLAFVAWEVADAVKAYAGTVLFGGADEATPFARQRGYSQLFLELKYSF